MLYDELQRCHEMIESLERAVSELPKGVINERKKRYKDNVYSYYYLKYREGDKVFNKHIAKKQVQEILEKLKLRKKYEKEMKLYKKKIAYLNKIMSAGKGRADAHYH
jgi:hypothetical protein